MIKSLEQLKDIIAEYSDEVYGADRPYQAPLQNLKEGIDTVMNSGDIEQFADCLLCLLDSFRKRYPQQSTSFMLIAAEHKLQVLRSKAARKINGA